MTAFKAATALLIGGCLWLALAGLANEPRVAIIHPPFMVSERQAISVQVRIPPHADNRTLVFVAADELGEVRRSDEELPGDRAPRTRWILWRDGLPRGDFVLIAALYGVSGKEVARATSPITVRGIGP